MKKLIIIALLICGIFTIPLTATTYRVNNKVPENAAAKIYSNLQVAHDAASNGDTIMVEGSPDTYIPYFICSKRLIFKGPGYFLDDNPGISANKLSAHVGDIRFATGSNGTTLIGIHLDNASIYSDADEITFRRCCIGMFYTQTTCDNISFAECYFLEGGVYINAIGSSGFVITNLVVMNCIFNDAILLSPGSTGLFLNNVFNTDEIVIPTGFDMKSNILFTTEKTNISLPALPDIDICNNISLSDHFGTANNNKANVSGSTLFLGSATASRDGRWQLMTGSPALGAGVSGIDCGAFGGPGPYILSGPPTGPVIYQLDVSSHSNAANKLPVTIKVKSY